MITYREAAPKGGFSVLFNPPNIRDPKNPNNRI